MKHLSYIFLIALFSLLSFSINAESKNDKATRKALEKLQEAKEDSIDCAKALEAVNKMEFAFMAERISFRANSAMVNDNMNFLATNGENAMLQIVPFMAGFDGINLKGRVTKSNVTLSKKGNTQISIDIFGTTLNARAMITLYKGSNQAMVVIMPNFRSGETTMYGKIFPINIFNEFEDALRY
ncbi:MAG: DUF4251 domain-containing protein [Muribaculaceae bacterium]|nr:DUF4251 domain-containing protein [Muribaculaceae bacterium]